MPKRSAGLLVYRFAGELTEVLLVHPGGPYWARRDEGAWSLPKGEIEPGEDARAAAFREFTEETALPWPTGRILELGEARQPSRKIVVAFAAEGDADPAALRSNLVEIEWPPRSGQRVAIPEVDRAAWFRVGEARRKVLPGQTVFLDRLLQAVGAEVR